MTMLNFFISNENSMIDLISQPWHWAVSGLMLAVILFLLTWMGRSFGISSSYEALCTAAGAGKRVPFFKKDLKEERWRFAFVAGAILGGLLAVTFLPSPGAVQISAPTVEYLSSIGMNYPSIDASGRGFVPTEIFNFSSLKGVLLALLGGFLVGFGARYGKGCTSGHAITGLAHLQLPSLLTVIGFFIGGLIMVHFFLVPLISL